MVDMKRELTPEHDNASIAEAQKTNGVLPPAPQLSQPADAVAPALADPDVDMPWYQKATPNRMPPPHIPFTANPGTLTAEQTLALADDLLDHIFADADLRRRYYNMSRTWHNNSLEKGQDGGDFEKQWLALLATELPSSGANLNTNDFGNIHRCMFFKLRRAMLAITGHDVHPNPNEPPPGNGILPKSFHWVPNDTSAPLGTYDSDTDLGFSVNQP